MDNQEAILNAELKERIKHQNTLVDIRNILATESGKRFIKYLFESFEVGELPVQGAEGSFLFDHLGFLRAGNSIFKIVAQANPEVARIIFRISVKLT